MNKQYWDWESQRLPERARVVRWGHYGAPVLLFPTAGGDYEEIERFQLIGALAELINSGKVKVYSVDSIAGRTWLRGDSSPEYCARVQNEFDAFVYHELAPLIRFDCREPHIEILTAGASIGAFNAVATVCRHPDVFRLAIAMSGTFDLSKYLKGRMPLDFHYSSPLNYLPDLAEGAQLARLRERFILLATGQGQWEDPGESWRLAHLLGSKGIPNRVDAWGREWDHDWNTWRAMLPKYLAEAAT
jgi:esterase/lipase superfamily enzyme